MKFLTLCGSICELNQLIESDYFESNGLKLLFLSSYFSSPLEMGYLVILFCEIC